MRLPQGVVAVPPTGNETAYEVKIAGSTVHLNEWALSPDTGERYQRDLGGKILREELDEEHSAFASRGSIRSDGEGAIEVWGYAPGLVCEGSDVTPETLDDVFSICASIRPASKPTEYTRLPKIRERPLLGMDTRGIENSQFTLTRMEWNEFSCDFVLNEIRRPERESHVETRKAAKGDVRIWWETDRGQPDIGRTTGWAERGKYCCGFNTSWWFQPADEEDYAPLIEACDNVEQDGWPEKFLPAPVK